MNLELVKKISQQNREENPIQKEDEKFIFNGKKAELVVVQPSELKEFMKDNRYMRPLQRQHGMDVIKSFIRYYNNNHFCQYTYPIAISVRNNNDKIIIDGQHRAFAAVETGKSLFAVLYYGLSLDEEMTLYFINNNMKMQSANHRMDLLARLDQNVRRIYNLLDNHLIGWDSESPSISRLNFAAAISLGTSPTPKRDIKKLPNYLEELDDIHYTYFNQILEILTEAYPYSPNFNNNKKKHKDRRAENFWCRSDLYLAAARFVVIYHMRFGNTFKNTERIVEFLQSIYDWEDIYQRSKIRTEGGGKFYTILNDLISIYNKGRRNSDYMIPPCDHKMLDTKMFPFFNDHLDLQGASLKARREKLVKKKKEQMLQDFKTLEKTQEMLK